MTSDPMLAKAERIEAELLKRALLAPKGSIDERVMQQAALLIQQMRVRLQGENGPA